MQDIIDRVKELIAKKEAIEAELQAIFGGQTLQRRVITCKLCGETGHNKATCPQKPSE